MADSIYIHSYADFENKKKNSKNLSEFRCFLFEFNCCECGKQTTKSGRRISSDRKLICKSCKTKKTSIKKYGCERPTQNKIVKEKVKQTNLKRYGCENPLQNETIKDKIKKTNLERYGVESVSKNKDIRNKAMLTNLKRYGVRHALQNDMLKDKAKQTFLKNYGCEYGFQSEIVKEKIKKTNIKKYGYERPAQNESVIEKFKKTNLEKYGCENPVQNASIYKKMFSSRKEKNGGFLSNAEKKFAEMLTNRHLDFEYEFFHNRHHFDFKVGDILVEIDGEYCHGLVSDSDGKHVQVQLEFERPVMAEPYKLLVIDSKNIDKGIDELLYMIGIDYEQWIQSIKDSLPKEFPYPEYSEKRMKSDWKKLRTYDYNNRQSLSQSIINNFHKSIWTSHVDNLPSPVEAWSNEELLDKCVRNRFIYKSALSSQPIAYGFNVCKIAPKVSVFNPSSARHLADKYLNEFEEVFDPFSGFSEIMMGVCSLGKKYIGQDISETAINESIEIKDFLGLNAVLSVNDSLHSSGEYECLFACLPNGLKEQWGWKSLTKHVMSG